MDCKGIDLNHPIDRMPPGSFPFIQNVRVVDEGRLDGRPGYATSIPPLPSAPNSIRRLNDPANNSYVFVGGVGTSLYAGQEFGYASRDTGYSGDPLSLIPFRPDQSPEPWMYVYDRLKMSKFRRDGVLRAIGVAPPTQAPVTEYGVPASVIINDGFSATGWANTGSATGGVSSGDRTNSSSYTIGFILYDSGSSGWACICPQSSSPQTYWMGERMQVVLNTGGGNQEKVTVREIHQPVGATTIEAIQYDSGNTGPCSLTLVGNPAGLERNSVIELDTGGGNQESVRILEVNLSPDGSAYSLRLTTGNTQVAGNPVVGKLTWYVYTTLTHAGGETIADTYLSTSMPSTGTGGMALLVSEDASHANGRPISSADDYYHISLFLQNPQNVTQVNLYIDVDANTTTLSPGTGAAFTRNFWKWTITQDQLKLMGFGGGVGDSWSDVTMAISTGTREGSDLTQTFANIKAIQVELITTGACSFGFDNWYFFGTYGPVIQPNSPVGIIYQSRFRDSSVGSRSVPGPMTRYQLFPLREAVIITPQTSTQAGVDQIDIYRQGGAVTTPLYVGTVENNTGSPNSYTDVQPDDVVLKINQPPDLTALQPWPLQIAPLIGECIVIGTSVIWTSGAKFPINLLNNTAISINGNTYLTYGQPHSDTFLEITQDAGYLASANFEIASPTLAGQPLPFAFGPLEGPFAPVIFGLGDPINGGLLYFCNSSDADSASDANNIDVSTPSSDLVSGAVWNGLCFCGSRDDIFCVRYSYLTTIGASNNTSFQWARVPTPSGMWSRWSVTACPVGVAYLGRDGIYICTEGRSVNITDEKLYSLFPHDGQPAMPVKMGPFTVYPVDMSQLTQLRLSYCDETLRFSYPDTNGSYHTLIYDIARQRWLYNTYANLITYHYLVEEAANNLPNIQRIMMLSMDTKSVMLAGGQTDNSADINTIVLIPSMDGGDERTQKLYVDQMTQFAGGGIMSVQPTFNNAQQLGASMNITCANQIDQFLQNIASLADLSLYRNVGAIYRWNGGPPGPQLYSWEMSGFIQPYLTSAFTIQFSPFSFPGWKHMRRMFPALISNNDISLTVKCQDGRTFGPYTIGSTAGQYRILPQMLDQNIKDLAFSLMLDGGGSKFAFFENDFVVEVKEWTEESYIKLAVFKA
jgi:hypothetical protein